MAISIWLECLNTSDNSECILSLGDNSSAVGWLFKSSHVDPSSLTFDAIQIIACKVDVGTATAAGIAGRTVSAAIDAGLVTVLNTVVTSGCGWVVTTDAEVLRFGTAEAAAGFANSTATECVGAVAVSTADAVTVSVVDGKIVATVRKTEGLAVGRVVGIRTAAGYRAGRAG